MIAGRGDLDDFGSGPPVYPVPGQPGSQPVLQCEPAHLPEPPGNRILPAFGKVPPVPAYGERLLDVGVDELPAHPLETRDVVMAAWRNSVTSSSAGPQAKRPLLRPHQLSHSIRQLHAQRHHQRRKHLIGRRLLISGHTRTLPDEEPPPPALHCHQREPVSSTRRVPEWAPKHPAKMTPP